MYSNNNTEDNSIISGYYNSNSGGYSPPTPTPQINLPSDATSSAAPILASRAAGYNGTKVIVLINLIFEVTPAATDSEINAFAVSP